MKTKRKLVSFTLSEDAINKLNKNSKNISKSRFVENLILFESNSVFDINKLTDIIKNKIIDGM